MATTKVKNFGKRIVHHPENDPPVVSTKNWCQSAVRNPKDGAIEYVTALFPIFGWITRYNLGWFFGDLIAGFTVGVVLVPQSMSYALIATLPSQYGLYSAFVGVLVYCLFATSKDVSIGPVAVMSLTVAQIIKSVEDAHPGLYSGPLIATTLSFLCGFIVLGLGLLRVGWLVEFIPAPAVHGFMTGSAISIATGQFPGLIGVSGFDTRAETYTVILNTLKRIPQMKLDAAFGIPALVSLYAIQFTFNYLGQRYPNRARMFFFMSIMRNGFILVLLTIVSFIYNRNFQKGEYPIRILQDVPRGFQEIGAPKIDSGLVSALVSKLPVATIILLLEHIAISKSFGRVNGYKIKPNQELIAIGVTNTVGSVFGAYPATGSFSRSALNSKSGVRTPLAGWFTALVVIVALYGLTPAFFWIPNAGLAAIIIHAVANLVTPPHHAYTFWRVSPLEFVIWFAAVMVTIFGTIEEGIYFSIAASLVLLLIRVAKPRGKFLGKITVNANTSTRDIYIPMKLDSPGVVNEHLKVQAPMPGVVIYRYEESVLYPNCSIMNDALVDYVKQNTRRGKDQSEIKASDRSWNDPGPKRGQDLSSEAAKPLLRAIVLDFSAISHIDTTGVQALVDTRSELERWVDGPVEFHFANILSPWIRRALIAGGFGKGLNSELSPTDMLHGTDLTGAVKDVPVTPGSFGKGGIDEEAGITVERKGSGSDIRVTVYGADSEENVSANASLTSPLTPFFHIDLQAAVQAAELRASRKGSRSSTEKRAM